MPTQTPKATVAPTATPEVVENQKGIKYVGKSKDIIPGKYTLTGNGAVKVYSVDVGHGQLAWKLVQDERVVCMDRTNIRYVTPEDIDDAIEFASIDVSFISLSLILPVMRNLLKENGTAVCLIKPQFEAGKDNVGKKGVVRDKSVHIAVINKIIGVIKENKFSLLGLDFSPVKGPEGNIEYLCYIKKTEYFENLTEATAENVVEASYKALN